METLTTIFWLTVNYTILGVLNLVQWLGDNWVMIERIGLFMIAGALGYKLLQDMSDNSSNS